LVKIGTAERGVRPNGGTRGELLLRASRKTPLRGGGEPKKKRCLKRVFIKGGNKGKART